MQMSMATIVTSGMKNPPKKLEFSQVLPTLALLFLRNRYMYLSKNLIRKYLFDNVFQPHFLAVRN